MQGQLCSEGCTGREDGKAVSRPADKCSSFNQISPLNPGLWGRQDAEVSPMNSGDATDGTQVKYTMMVWDTRKSQQEYKWLVGSPLGSRRTLKQHIYMQAWNVAGGIANTAYAARTSRRLGAEAPIQELGWVNSRPTLGVKRLVASWQFGLVQVVKVRVI